MYPQRKRFAFTIFDDTDVGTLDSLRPIYDLLGDLGLRTTKSVWPVDYAGDSAYRGSATLEDDDYCRYLLNLKSLGFEIAYHGATMESADRETSMRALALFRRVFGQGPRSYAAHAQNRDNLYWGRERFRFGLCKSVYQRLAGSRDRPSEGHVPGSRYYWSDLAPEIAYVRSFTYTGINLDRISRCVPYRTANTPGVAAWFPTCDADNVEEFAELLTRRNVDELEANNGLCIVSTHLGKGFVRNGEVHAGARHALEYLSKRDGWFVPVSEMLDYLAHTRGIECLRGWRLFRLEALWFLHSLLRRRHTRAYEATEVPYLEAAARCKVISDSSDAATRIRA